MDRKRQLAFAIVKHLRTEIAGGSHSEDISESLEVAIQCLEQAYNINSSGNELDCGKSLVEIFEDGIKPPEISASVKELAEKLKAEGNELMNSGLYKEAADTYTKAIQIDTNNAVYFSNRAAAYVKLGQNENAIEDCKKSISIDPSFKRAYGRMGLAQLNMEKFVEARESYKKALSLDPENTGYKQNLELIEKKLAEKRGPSTGPGGMPNLGGLDIGSLLSNPAVMNMAQSFMQNPQMQQMFAGVMGGGGASAAEDVGNPTAGPGQPSLNMQDIFGATQSFAQQMQQDNPELVEQLRSQFRGNNPPDSEQQDQ